MKDVSRISDSRVLTSEDVLGCNFDVFLESKSMLPDASRNWLVLLTMLTDDGDWSFCANDHLDCVSNGELVMLEARVNVLFTLYLYFVFQIRC